jgi:predicted RNase H-like nuclease (RuvC/YqgF family)
LHISLPHYGLFVSRDDSTAERLREDVHQAEEMVRCGHSAVSYCKEQIDNEKSRLEGLRATRNQDEAKSQEEVSAEENIERLQAELDEAERDLACAQRHLDFAMDCEQNYMFRS